MNNRNFLNKFHTRETTISQDRFCIAEEEPFSIPREWFRCERILKICSREYGKHFPGKTERGRLLFST